MSNVKEFLLDITAATQTSRVGFEPKGRMKRTPNYTNPKVSSTRPRSDRGVTFHFAHKTISKRNDISESQRDATSAPSHQSYIERLEAVEVSSLEQEKYAEAAGIRRGYILHNDNFSYPDLTIENGRQSFGTLGGNKADRVEFWRKVEVSEGRTARVQNRIIAELPHEVSQEERLQISMKFCSYLHEEALPFWATIHAPTKANDARNYHLHIAYYDRPAAINEEHNWDFSILGYREKPNRTKVQFRPFKQNKSDVVRSIKWVKKLRQSFAESNNEILEKGGYEKRLDERSYKESGIKKLPTEHLGFKSNAAEKFGLETTRGLRNTEKEYAWRMEKSTARWDDLINLHDTSLIHQEFVSEDEWTDQKKIKTALKQGREAALLASKIELLSEALTTRVSTRKKFLKDEYKRITSNEKLRSSVEFQQALILINIEDTIIDNRQPELTSIQTMMKEKSSTQKILEETIWLDISPKVEQHNRSHNVEIFSNLPTYPIGNDFERFDDHHNDTAEEIDVLINDVFSEEVVEDNRWLDESDPIEETAQEQNQSTENVSQPGQNIEELSPSNILKPTIPGTLLIPDIENREELKVLNERLLNMNNREVRVRAITSRDASEFLDHGEEKHQAKRGWIVLRSEAQKRGINLETGLQDIENATDKQRAQIHTDQSNESVLEIRQELVRVMSR